MKRGPKPKPPELRPMQLTVRLQREQMDALRLLATLYGTSLAGAMEQCVKATWDAVTPAQKRALSQFLKAREEAT